MDDQDNVFARHVIHMDSTDSGRQRALQRRAEEAKSKRLDAQFRMLEAMPAALAYVEGVLTGTVESDPEKTKISLSLLDRVLPKLSAVRVDAAQVVGVDEVATGTAANRAWENAWLNAAAECSKVWREQDEEARAQAQLGGQTVPERGVIEGEVAEHDQSSGG